MPGNPRTRRRPLPYRIPGRHETQDNSTTQPGYNPWSTVVLNQSAKDILGEQVTVSEGHPWPPRKGQVADIGGDFFTSKKYIGGKAETRYLSESQTVPVFYGIYSSTDTQKYQGPIIPFDPSVWNGFDPWPSRPSQINAIDLNEAGATAIARCKPTNSVADASVFLGELYREGIPKLAGIHTWKHRTEVVRDVKTAGGNYLGYEFGWKPLVNDIRKFAEAVGQAQKVLAQYERDAGGVVRRQYQFPIEELTLDRGKVAGGAPYGPTLSQHFVGSSGTTGEIHRVDRYQRRIWFSGAFTYHLPAGYDSRKAMDRGALYAKKLLGLELSPDVLWNLTPWSWAIDWFSNTGDVVDNLSDWATDGLVLRYGYIMEHVVMSSTFTHQGTKYKSGIPVQPLVFNIETKTRRRANPFGFGVSWEALSARQIAILTALGITRA